RRVTRALRSGACPASPAGQRPELWATWKGDTTGMRKAKGLLGIIVGLFLLLHAGGTLANADDQGNNGTLKVVSATDPGADMDNDPKVCNFHLAGFKFDANSAGTWSIAGQGGGAGSGTAGGSWTANAS